MMMIKEVHLSINDHLTISFYLSHILLAGVVNVLTTTPLWVVNTRLKMKGLGSRTGHGSSERVANQYSGLLGMMAVHGFV
jgi:adenine nucleotide transporter 17